MKPPALAGMLRLRGHYALAEQVSTDVPVRRYLAGWALAFSVVLITLMLLSHEGRL